MKPITKPGIYPDVDPDDYHNGLFPDTVSYSTLKLLLEEAGPAKYKQALTGPRVEKRVFDLGTGLHALLLGKGEERLRVITQEVANSFVDDPKKLLKTDPPTWQTNAAKDARDTAYAEGMTPLLVKDMDALQAVADTVPDHIKEWFTDGTAEVAFRWEHSPDLHVRGQIDYLRDDMIVDLKTVRATDTRTLERQIFDLKYYLQAATYRTAYGHLTGNWLPYYIVAIDLANPHLSRVVEIAEAYLMEGANHLNKAISVYLECQANNDWPAYDPKPAPINPPPWLTQAQANAEIAALEQLLGDTNE